MSQQGLEGIGASSTDLEGGHYLGDKMKEQDGQVITYSDGHAWGIAPNGETICLGAEPEIRAILANPRKHPRNPTIAQVISLERKLLVKEDEKGRKEQRKAEEERKERRERAKSMGIKIRRSRKK